MSRLRASRPVVNAPTPTKLPCPSEICPTQPVRITSENAMRVYSPARLASITNEFGISGSTWLSGQPGSHGK
jgi:hypothetical protein